MKPFFMQPQTIFHLVLKSLYYIVLYCIVLYMLCCVVLLYVVLYCIVLCVVVCCCIVLYCVLLYCVKNIFAKNIFFSLFHFRFPPQNCCRVCILCLSLCIFCKKGSNKYIRAYPASNFSFCFINASISSPHSFRIFIKLC